MVIWLKSGSGYNHSRATPTTLTTKQDAALRYCDKAFSFDLRPILQNHKRQTSVSVETKLG